MAAGLSREQAMNATRLLAPMRVPSATFESTIRHAPHQLAKMGIRDEAAMMKVFHYCVSTAPCASSCKNGGQCESDGRTYYCRCPEHFSGKRCEKAPCTPNPCQHGGNCSFTAEQGERCSCGDGYGGKTCAVVVDPCIQRPCRHGGECIKASNHYRCICGPDYHGKHCQHRRGVTKHAFEEMQANLSAVQQELSSIPGVIDSTLTSFFKKTVGQFLDQINGKLEQIQKAMQSFRATQRTIKNNVQRLDEKIRKVNRTVLTNGWTYCASSLCHFKAIPGERTFDQAQRECLANGGQLASIVDSSEQECVNELLQGRVMNVWIGGTDRSRKRDWNWLDGTPLQYTNWDRGEPNQRYWNHHRGHPIEEDCLELIVREDGTSAWNDLQCSGLTVSHLKRIQASLCKMCLQTSVFQEN